MPLNLLEYSFSDVELLETALTHRSVGKHNYERLEFLGDSILGFVITDVLYHSYPNESEGILTRLRANLVNKEALANLARNHELGDYIKLGPGERKSGGWRRDSILANSMEAIIGAVYLDSDISKCRKFILAIYEDVLNELDADNVSKDPKTQLQELLQSRKIPLPKYTIMAEQGEAHRKTFTVSCEILGLEHEIQGEGKSKRSAEQSAASKALKLIES